VIRPLWLVPPGRRIAGTGDCLDGLTITVDVRDGTIVSIDPASGPQAG
jgi:hypothetical protein